MTPAAIAITPARMNTIFNNATVKVMNTEDMINSNPIISTPNPSQTFMNQSNS